MKLSEMFKAALDEMYECNPETDKKVLSKILDNLEDSKYKKMQPE